MPISLMFPRTSFRDPVSRFRTDLGNNTPRQPESLDIGRIGATIEKLNIHREFGIPGFAFPGGRPTKPTAVTAVFLPTGRSPEGTP